MMFEGKKLRLAVWGFVVMWVFSLLVTLGLLVGVVWVAIHFLAKVW